MSELTDPLRRKDEADDLLERAATQLRVMLREAVAQLDPFPPFPGAFFTLAIEVEPGAAGDPQRGCVVVCPDGELYELVMGVDLDSLALGHTDPVALRKEEMKRLDLHPQDSIVYAYNALTRVTELLLEQQAAKDGSG